MATNQNALNNTLAATSLTGTLQAGQFPALTGAVTTSAGSLTTAIAAGAIVNADVNASAAIDVSKLAALTSSRAVVTDGSGFLAAATTTATEIGYVNGVTSAIQTQLDGKQPTGSYLTAVTANAPLSGSGTSGSHLVISQANGSTDGYLSSTDWNTFNNKGSGTVTSVSGTSNRITSSGGATPAIDISASYVGQASIVTTGTLTTGATGAGFTVALSTSTITGTLAVANGGTGQTTYTNGQLLIGNTAGNTLAKATLTQGGGITITNGSGSITFGVSALQTAWIPAAAMRPSSSGGCAALALTATGANQPDISSLDFDQTTAEYAQFGIRFPKGWNEGTVTAVFYWTANSTSTNSVIWGIQGVAVSDNDAIGAAYGTAQTVTDANGSSAYTLRVSAATSAITIAGTPAVGDEVFFRVYRDAAAGGDTLAADALLLGVALFYTIDTLDDT